MSTVPGRRLAAADAVLRPVRAGNAFEEAVEALLRTIRLGVVSPGDRLPPERELASRLGVSRATVREAIAALADAGHLTSRRGRYGGTFVVSPAAPTAPLAPETAASLEDVLVFREAVECGAAAAAARAPLDEADKQHLVERQKACAQAADYRPADSRFHLAVAEASGSALLLNAVADARVRANELLDAIPLLPRNIDHSERQHRGILRAILAGNPDSARSAMAEHLEGTAALLRGFLG
ncbi:FadR/GntR family transcriptional regulator [Fodinicola feengrottensis]|uniref:GntR family transcriptional regulator n=1 Tax=Fodinicola feengrottensis TaxID=435914 RepID=A0ABN2HMV7_9ACTN|nr:FCD domain-containing protein [Fodinicola feengrottensis]